MLRACVLDFQESWSKYLLLIEFAYNDSYQATISVDAYEMLYGRKCRSPIHWDEIGKRKYLGLKVVRETTEAVEKIKKENASSSK